MEIAENFLRAFLLALLIVYIILMALKGKSILIIKWKGKSLIGWIFCNWEKNISQMDGGTLCFI